MWTMRLAGAADRLYLEQMIDSRARWMRARGLRGWEGWQANKRALAAQAGDPTWPLWVLLRAGQLVGQTTLLDGEPPSSGWTALDRSQSAISMHSTVTDPRHAGQGISGVIAAWAVDHAARRPVRWVRRTVGPDDGLLRLCRAQGWEVVRQASHAGQPCWLLQRAAQRQAWLDGLLVEKGLKPVA